MLWFDIYLPEKAISYLWDIINQSSTEDAITRKKGIIVDLNNESSSDFKQDKDNWFFNNILKDCSEYVYYANWNNYHDIIVKKSTPRPVFVLNTMWVNRQKQTEFVPPHIHEAFYSFVVFMKIPTQTEEQHALPFCKTVPGNPVSSDFQFLFGNERGYVQTIPIPLGPKDEGRMLFFPSWLMHQVFPFYGTEEERITLSGNILIDKHNLEK